MDRTDTASFRAIKGAERLLALRRQLLAGDIAAASYPPFRHVIFTIDGHNPVGDARRMHTMRRTLCRSWRNDRWRDLLLAFVYWLGQLRVDLGDGAEMVLSLPPMSFEADFGLGPPVADGDGADSSVDEDDDPLTESEELYGGDTARDEEPA